MSEARVALFMTGLAGGGAERVMLTLAEEFARSGHKVDLVVTSARGPLRKDVPDTVRLVDLGAPRIICSLPALVRYFRREHPVAMLSAMCSANCVAIWAKSLARARTRLIVCEHSTLSRASESALTRRGRLLPTLMRYTYPKADGVVAVSRGVADDLAQAINFPSERIEVIYNPVVTPRMLELSRQQPDHPWFTEGEPPVILAVGRLTKAKDFPTLMRAFAVVRQQRTARLMILGEGEEREALERLAAELGIESEVVLPGFASNPYAYMRAASVFVLSSRWEGFGNVLVEAMACGTPVVATDCQSGPAEIIEDGKWGGLVSAGNAGELAGAIQHTLAGCANIQSCDRAKDFKQEYMAPQYLKTLHLDAIP